MTQDTLDLPDEKKPTSKVKGQGVKKTTVKTPRPKPLAERIRATELATQFSRAKAADLQEILESLVTLGRARRDGEKFSI